VNKFLKIALLVIVALVALKFLPLIFGLGCLLAAAVLAVILMVASALAGLFGSAFLLAAVLSPIWVSVLIIVGLIALIKRGTRQSGVVPT
jgi:hypothetical protein